MMLPELFDLVIFVMVFSIGALASPVGEIAEPATERSDLAKRFSGTRWTWYVVETGNEVYCGGRRSNYDMIVALSGQNMNPSLCGKQIKMTYNGKTGFATVVDMCPGCPERGLDLSPSLFSYFAPQDNGVISGDWVFV